MIEVRFLVGRDQTGAFLVDGASFTTSPSVRREEAEEIVLGIEVWAKGIAKAVRFDKTAAPRIHDAIENAGKKLIEHGAATLLGKLFNSRRS